MPVSENGRALSISATEPADAVHERAVDDIHLVAVAVDYVHVAFAWRSDASPYSSSFPDIQAVTMSETFSA